MPCWLFDLFSVELVVWYACVLCVSSVFYVWPISLLCVSHVVSVVCGVCVLCLFGLCVVVCYMVCFLL